MGEHNVLSERVYLLEQNELPWSFWSRVMDFADGENVVPLRLPCDFPYICKVTA